MKTMSSSELAWAAGFFDGEGCSYKPKDKNFGRISISQKDKRVLERFQKAVDAGQIYNGSKRDQDFKYIVQGKTAKTVMDKLWPYLGEIKKSQWLRVTTGVEYPEEKVIPPNFGEISLKPRRSFRWYENPDILRAAYEKYGTLEAAASALGGAHKSTLAYWWKRHGFEKLPRGQNPSKTNREALKELADSIYGNK